MTDLMMRTEHLSIENPIQKHEPAAVDEKVEDSELDTVNRCWDFLEPTWKSINVFMSTNRFFVMNYAFNYYLNLYYVLNYVFNPPNCLDDDYVTDDNIKCSKAEDSEAYSGSLAMISAIFLPTIFFIYAIVMSFKAGDSIRGRNLLTLISHAYSIGVVFIMLVLQVDTYFNILLIIYHGVTFFRLMILEYRSRFVIGRMMLYVSYRVIFSPLMLINRSGYSKRMLAFKIYLKLDKNQSDYERSSAVY